MREESHDDSDLADLLGSAAVPRPASGSYAKVQERVYHNYYQRHPSMSCCDYISAYLSMYVPWYQSQTRLLDDLCWKRVF
jgi:hypothetical protein